MFILLFQLGHPSRTFWRWLALLSSSSSKGCPGCSCTFLPNRLGTILTKIRLVFKCQKIYLLCLRSFWWQRLYPWRLQRFSKPKNQILYPKSSAYFPSRNSGFSLWWTQRVDRFVASKWIATHRTTWTRAWCFGMRFQWLSVLRYHLIGVPRKGLFCQRKKTSNMRWNLGQADLSGWMLALALAPQKRFCPRA